MHRIREARLAREGAAGEHGGPLCKEALKVLNGAFPKNMVDATDPNYERELLKKLPLQ